MTLDYKKHQRQKCDRYTTHALGQARKEERATSTKRHQFTSTQFGRCGVGDCIAGTAVPLRNKIYRRHHLTSVSLVCCELLTMARAKRSARKSVSTPTSAEQVGGGEGTALPPEVQVRHTFVQSCRKECIRWQLTDTSVGCKPRS